jgi:hypothetical protein
MSDPQDDVIRRLFELVREEDERLTPSCEQILSGRGRRVGGRRLPAVRNLALAGAAAVLLVCSSVLMLWRREQPVDSAAAALSLVGWQSPTETLLTPPGLDIWTLAGQGAQAAQAEGNRP